MAEPELILHNARVLTQDAARPEAGAFAVRGGRIAAVGASAEILGGRGRGTRILDAAGRAVTPGIFDAHPHMDREGLKRRGGIAIRGLASVAEIVAVVREAAARTPPGAWIVTMPMELAPKDGMPRYVNDPGQLAEGRFPDRRDLDAAAPDNPVLIRGIWGWWGVPPFPSVASSAALALAAIDRDTRAPHGTEIERDAAGEPTGVMRETNRAPVLEYTLFGALPRFTFADRLAAARTAPRLYNAAGTTAGYEGHGLTPAIVESYRRADAAGDLTVRLATTLSVPSGAMDDRGVGDYLRSWAGRIAAPGGREGNLTTATICEAGPGGSPRRAAARGIPTASASISAIPTSPASSPPATPTSNGPGISTSRSPSTGWSRSRRSPPASASASPASPTTSRRCCAPTRRSTRRSRSPTGAG